MEDLEDLTQDFFVQLLMDEGRVLRSWEPAPELSLADFVGHVAERWARSALRDGEAAAPGEVPTDHGALAQLSPAIDSEPEGAMEARERVDDARERLAAELTTKGASLLRLALLEGLDLDALCEWTGLTPAAVSAWRGGLRRRLRQLDLHPASRSEEGEAIRLVA